MMTKPSRVHKSLPMRVVTTDDIVQTVKHVLGRMVTTRYVYVRYIRPLLEKGLLIRVRRGLYVVRDDPDTYRHFPASTSIIMKVRPRGFLGYYDALDVWRAAHTAFFVTRICVKKDDAFRPFEFMGQNFEPLVVSDTTTDIVRVKRDGVMLRVSSRERTILDSIERPWLVGGWEDLYKSIMCLDSVNMSHLMDLLHNRIRDYEKRGRDGQMLIRRLGLVLTMLKEDSPYFREVDDHIEELEQMVHGPPRFIHSPDRASRCGMPSYLGRKGLLVRPWQLIVPPTFEIAIRGRLSNFNLIFGYP